MINITEEKERALKIAEHFVNGSRNFAIQEILGCRTKKMVGLMVILVRQAISTVNSNYLDAFDCAIICNSIGYIYHNVADI